MKKSKNQGCMGCESSKSVGQTKVKPASDEIFSTNPAEAEIFAKAESTQESSSTTSSCSLPVILVRASEVEIGEQSFQDIKLPRKRASPDSASQASPMEIIQKKRRNSSLSIDTSCSSTNQPVVSLCAKKLGFHEYPSGRHDNQICDMYWYSGTQPDFNSVPKSSLYRINRFPGMAELSKKTSLSYALSSMEKLFPKTYMFYPRSFVLPAHYDDLKAYWNDELRRRKEKGLEEEQYFIVKPNDGAQGNGIYLINNLNQIKEPTMKQLVQEYVSDPFLMKDKLKFDFRVYAVIRSLNPLEIYVSREGMARFCTMKYQKPAPNNFSNPFFHLTNYSLNKTSKSYIHSNSLEEQVTGSKRLLSTVFYQMNSCGVKTKKLWHEIKLIIMKTVLALVPELMIHYEHYFNGMPGPHCFQIVGFDIMIREDGSPVLLEVNASPSLSIDHTPDSDSRQKSIVDEVIKIPLVRDTLLLATGQLPELTKPACSGNDGNSRSTDDLRVLKVSRRPYLSEIFPNRYGNEVSDLLFLDQMVYIFMQYANLRTSTSISLPSLRRMIKDIGIETYFSANEVQMRFVEISNHFNSDANINKGLPFHGFFNFMIFLANTCFIGEPTLQTRLTNLMKICGKALRNKGVQSQRLCREEIGGKSGSAKRIYMLPSRICKRRSKSCEPIKNGYQKVDRYADRNNNTNKISFPQIIHK